MAAPSSYLSTAKNLPKIFAAIQRAAVPQRFGYDFLKQLGFSSSSDRPVIPVLKAIGFLDDGHKPTERYRRYKDPGVSGAVIAEALRDAYSDLFAIDTEVHERTPTELRGLFARLTGKSEEITAKMATTFTALCALADFGAVTPDPPTDEEPLDETMDDAVTPETPVVTRPAGAVLQLRHDVHIHLPESTNVAVYDAIFKSIRTNLLP